jgi:hypothetical protein
VIPVLARSCVDRVKVLRGVAIHGDRRADLEDALPRSAGPRSSRLIADPGTPERDDGLDVD